MPEHATRDATPTDRFEAEQDRFIEDLGGDPPGLRPLVAQILGWALILQGLALFLVAVQEAHTQGVDVVRHGALAAAGVLFAGTGVGVDRARAWAWWPAVLLSSGGTLVLAGTYWRTGSVLSAVGAIWDGGILVGLILLRTRLFHQGGSGA